MKNKILYIITALVFSFCFMNYSMAQEADLSSMVSQTTMPSDEEILQTIRKFNFDKSQEEYLFKETKKKLIELYSNKNFSSVIQGESTINQNLQQQEILNNSSQTQTVRSKKYASHPSLTKRRN